MANEVTSTTTSTDQEKFLRPETLYNATKCQSYLGEIPPEEPCNVPDVIAPSSPLQPPAPAGGDSPKRQALPSSETLKSVGDVLGSLDLNAATTRGH